MARLRRVRARLSINFLLVLSSLSVNYRVCHESHKKKNTTWTNKNKKREEDEEEDEEEVEFRSVRSSRSSWSCRSAIPSFSLLASRFSLLVSTPSVVEHRHVVGLPIFSFNISLFLSRSCLYLRCPTALAYLSQTANEAERARSFAACWFIDSSRSIVSRTDASCFRPTLCTVHAAADCDIIICYY